MTCRLGNRALVWGALLFGLAILTPCAQAQAPQSLRLTDAPVLSPASLAVDDTGQTLALWWSAADTGAELLLSRPPASEPLVIAQLDPDRPLTTQLPLALGPHGEAGWALPLGEGAILYRRAADGARSEAELPTLPRALAFAPDGQLYWASNADGELLLGALGKPAQVIGAPGQVDALALCVAAAGRWQVAVASSGPPAEAGIVLYAADRDLPLRLADRGSEPRLACGADGAVHLAWRQEQGLVYAPSGDWFPQPPVKTTGLSAWALAPGEAGQAYLAWAETDAVWLASSADWAARRSLAAVSSPEGFALALNDWAQPQLLWWGAAPDGAAIYYANETRAPAQLRVVVAGQETVLDPATRLVALSNLPAAQIQKVRFYLTARVGPTAGAWRWLADDGDGSDGFSTQVLGTLLQPGQEYAVVALAQLADGRNLVAQSAWLPAESGWPAILAGPQMEVWRGVADVRILPLVTRSQDEIYELWLQPLAEGEAFGEPYYLGAQTLPANVSARAWHAWPVDARRAPDGRYTLFATIATADGPARLSAAGEVMIDQAGAPQIAGVTVELAGRERDRLRVQVDAHDLDGAIARVDLFLVPRTPLSAELYAAPVWLGSDANALGGWSLDLPLSPAWRGSAWVVRAVAYDDHDLPSAASFSAELFIPPPGLQMRFIRPGAGRLPAGQRTVALIVDEGVAQVERVAFYLQDATGALRLLGEGRPQARLFKAEFDTQRLPVGSFRLVAEASVAGLTSLWPGPEIEIDHHTPSVTLLGPQDEPLRGSVRHEVLVQREVAPVVSARFTLSDAQGVTALLGVDDTPADGLAVDWEARAFMPSELAGLYMLGCTLVDAQGHASHHAWPVTIGNRWELAGPFLASRVAGVTQLAWEAGNLPPDAELTIDYSPDGGAHWLAVGKWPVAEQRAMVDTAQLPDSVHARFRLTWVDGDALAAQFSLPVVVENQPDSPQLAVLAPQAGAPLSQQALVAWQASDPEGDQVVIDIWARQAQTAWLPVALGLANTGRYEWDTAAWPTGADWELRVTARDEGGLVREVLVSELSLTHNRPPVVRLVWPNSEVALNSETVVLWSAFDLDGDELLIDLYYSDNAGQTWYALAEGLPNTGYYSWETAFAPPGAAYRVRVVARDGQLARRAQSSGLSTIGGGALVEIRLLTPLPETELRRVVALCWLTPQLNSDLAVVTLEARETRTGALEPISAAAPLTGCALWDTLYVPDGAYELLLTGYDAAGAVRARSTTPLQVRNLRPLPPRARWLLPLPAPWQNEPVALRWQATDPSGGGLTAQVQASMDRGQTWEPFANVDAALNFYLWEPSPDTGNRWVRLVFSDVRGMATALSPLVFAQPTPELAPNIALNLARVGPGRVARWLAQDAADQPLTVSLLWRDALGNATLLAAGQEELGELLLPPEPATATGEVCALADSGQIAGFVCEPLVAPLRWMVTPQQPEFGAPLTAVTTIRWQVTTPQGVPQLAAQRLWWSRDGRRSWAPLADLPPEARRYDWDTSALPGGDYWLRLEALGDGQAASSEWGPLTLTTTRPQASFTLAGLYPQEPISGAWTLRWRSWQAPPEARVNLSYKTAPSAPWRMLAQGLPPDGQFAWDTTALPNGSRVWLRGELVGSGWSVVHTPSLPLTLQHDQAPLLQLLPTAKADGVAGAGVCWQARQAVAASVRLSFSPDGGATWTTLGEGLAAAGCQELDLATLQGAWPLLRAVAVDAGRQSVDMISWERAWPYAAQAGR